VTNLHRRLLYILRIHIHIYTHIYICICIYICTHTHTHVYSCIHTYQLRGAIAPYHVIQRDCTQSNDLLYVILNAQCKEKNSLLKATLSDLFQELESVQATGVNGVAIEFWLTSDWKMVAALLGCTYACHYKLKHSKCITDERPGPKTDTPALHSIPPRLRNQPTWTITVFLSMVYLFAKSTLQDNLRTMAGRPRSPQVRTGNQGFV
jgi:hypothetical protein